MRFPPIHRHGRSAVIPKHSNVIVGVFVQHTLEDVHLRNKDGRYAECVHEGIVPQLLMTPRHFRAGASEVVRIGQSHDDASAGVPNGLVGAARDGGKDQVVAPEQRGHLERGRRWLLVGHHATVENEELALVVGGDKVCKYTLPVGVGSNSWQRSADSGDQALQLIDVEPFGCCCCCRRFRLCPPADEALVAVEGRTSMTPDVPVSRGRKGRIRTATRTEEMKSPALPPASSSSESESLHPDGSRLNETFLVAPPGPPVTV
mmetsp:Transcript_13692/g.39249  ORF Transcript_13692/g.39249 Transcript_13692/m.39249 type:complete len:261 (+) Transcript_13692:1226-2008(+)